MKAFALSAALVLASSICAGAQEEVDCADAMAQQDMNRCADDDYRVADRDLNIVWKKAQAAAKAADEEQPDVWRGASNALLAGQRGWIAYRDGQCELAGFEARGGSMEPMLVSGCLAKLTRARTKELQLFIDGP